MLFICCLIKIRQMLIGLLFGMLFTNKRVALLFATLRLNQLIGCQYLSVKFIFLYAILFLGIPNNPPNILWKVFLYVVKMSF